MPAEERSRRWQKERASCRWTGEKAEGLTGASFVEIVPLCELQVVSESDSKQQAKSEYLATS